MYRVIIKKRLKDLKNEDGAGTAFAMLFALICIGIGGLAIDASNVWSVKQRLQAATDVSAHAAAVSLVFPGQTSLSGTTSEVAIATLLENMPEAQYGVALQASDVTVGYWNSSTLQMSASAVDASGNPLLRAVGVTSRLDGEVGNVVPTFILKLIGFDFWQVSTSSVFVRDTPWCFTGGFIAGGQVDLASNNEFINGFCIHGNGGVDVNSNIIFGTGVRVSMPNSDLVQDGGLFDLKGTNHTWVDGMENQVGDQYLAPSLATVASITDIIADLQNPVDPNLPGYIKRYVPGTDADGNEILIETDVEGEGSAIVKPIPVTPENPLQVGQLLSGAINVITCPNKGLDFPDDMAIENMIIIANCKINFGQNGYVTNAIIATTNTGNQSFNASASLQLGLDDECEEGGGVSLFTLGDAHFSAQTAWDGVEVIANGDVHISAQADGLEGVHVEAEGDIFATSDLGFGSCNGGVDPYRKLYIVRMVY